MNGDRHGFWAAILPGPLDRVTVQFWYNTDLRYDKLFFSRNLGSPEMMSEIKEWLER